MCFYSYNYRVQAVLMNLVKFVDKELGAIKGNWYNYEQHIYGFVHQN